MAVSSGGQIMLSSTVKLHEPKGVASSRNWRLVKYCNGEVMGRKLELQLGSGSSNISSIGCSKKHISMSLTADVANESKLRDIDMEKRDPRTVVAIILGGGAGTRLFPLTKRRAKPAVPIGGAYRLIDVPMSNCINSGINKVYILTQFNSASLNRHIARAYNSGNGITFGDGYVEVLAATQTPGEQGKKWFQGTADAVRQFHWLFEDPRSKDIEDVLILSGDHLYRMDYMDFVKDHRESGADITLSCLPMDDSRASDFGLMKIDNKGRILSFSEKPKGEELKSMQVDTTVLGLPKDEALKKPYIASMGVYVFKKEILLNLLRWRFPTANDFGSEVIPASAKEFYMKAYLFNDYWEDIGTIRSFFEANLALTEHPPRFSFYDAAKPMYTSRRNLPPSKIDNSKIVDSIVSHGSFLNNTLIEHSVVGIRSRINSNVHLKDTVMLGADFYETESEMAALLAEGRVPIGIGENTKIKDCIIDKNARIGKNVVIANSEIGLLFFITGFWGFFPLFQAIFTFPTELVMLEKERSSGMYRLSSYFMSRIVADLPMELVLPTIFLLITYFMAGLKATAFNFFYTLFSLFLLNVLVAQGLGLAIGAVVLDQKSAATLASVIMLCFLLAGGFYVQNIPKFIAWFKYISIGYYTYQLFIGSQYSTGDTYPCDSGMCPIEEFPSIKKLGFQLHGEALAVLTLVIMLIGYRLTAYFALMRIGVTKKLK